MTRLPSLSGEQIIKALGKAGFQVLGREGATFISNTPMGGLQWCRYIRASLWEEDS